MVDSWCSKMPRKVLHLEVDLEIQAVTCPGVWLCRNGHVQLLFSMLGQEVQTNKLPPVFPLLFHQNITFQKTYPNAGCLAEVQDSLARENVYAVLMQEVEDSLGGSAVQLARFHSNALHILYPSPCSKGLLAGVDVDLLMEASADYPGILCPKIEISTKTVVKEITSNIHGGHIISPKTLSSQRVPLIRHSAQGVRTINSDGSYRIVTNKPAERSRKVRHSQVMSHNSGICRSAPSLPQNRGNGSNVSGHLKGHLHCTDKCGFDDTAAFQEFCQCGAGHLPSKCPLCTQYKAYFSSSSDPPDTFQENKNYHTDMCHQRKSIANTFERTKRLSHALHSHVDRILKPTITDLINEKDHYICSYEPFTHSQPKYSSNESNSPEQQFDQANSHKKASKSDPCLKVSYGRGDEFNSHRQLFYANLEKFYRKLYDRTRTRVQEENGFKECRN